MASVRNKILAVALAILLIGGIFVGLEAVCYHAAKKDGWLGSWEYLTASDPELGYRLRPEIQMTWHRTGIAVNRSGFRDQTTGSKTVPKRNGELLIAAIGDSITFGAFTHYQHTYPVVLQRYLAARLASPVRVVNLGVPGYSSFQVLLNLKRWAHLRPDIVLFTECFNDRAQARPDTEQIFSEEFDELRPYEIGNWISYLKLWWYRSRVKPLKWSPLPLDKPLPEVRVPLKRYPKVLHRIVDTCEKNNARLFFIGVGGDARVDRMTREGINHVRAGQWQKAEEVFDRLVKLRPGWPLNWHYLHRAKAELDDRAGAGSLEEPYRALVSSHYMGRFSHYSCEYVERMGSVATSRKVAFIDMREHFSRQKIRFYDDSHFESRGQTMIARVLARRIAELEMPAAR